MSDLISREALKKDLITFFPDKCLDGITAKTLFKQILTDIDNAPTVKPCENCDLYFKAMTKEEMKKAELDKMPMISKKHKGGAE